MKEQPMRQFYLHSRKGIVYVQFVDPVTKKCLTSRSTRRTSRDEALLVVYEWLTNGIPKKQLKKPRSLNEELTLDQILAGLKTIPLTTDDVSKIERVLLGQGLITAIIRKNSYTDQNFVDFLKNFWNYDTSPYVEEKLSHKLYVGKEHIEKASRRVELYWSEYFQGVALGEVSREMLNKFSIYLSKKHSHLSSGTLRNIFQIGVRALRWAYANEYIEADPTTYLMGYSLQQKDRGVLSPQEAVELFSYEWRDYRRAIS